MDAYYFDFIIFIAIILLLLISQLWIKKVYGKYSAVPANLEITGKEIVDKMLMNNGINDVSILATRGILDDHYNSSKKTINLSKKSIETNSIAAIAVCAHETGHACQDHNGYYMMKIRKLLGPICSFSARLVWISIIAGIVLGLLDLIVLGMILMGVTILFQLVTLPVEFDASKRAVKYLSTVGFDEETMYAIKKVLKAAAFTYLASTIASILQLLRLILNVSRD